MSLKPGLIIDALVRMGYPLTEFPEGEILIREGTRERSVYVLYEGEVSVTQNYRELAVITDPGAMLGEVASLLNIERSATVTVTRPSTFFVIDDLQVFLGENSPLAMAVMKNMAQQILDRDKMHTGIYIGLKKLRERRRRRD